MEGIMVLNQYLHEGTVIAPWLGIGIGCCVGGLFGVIISSILEKTLGKLYAPFMVICSIAFTFGMFFAAFAPREETVRYQVLIEDGVDFNSFNERYKIISQEGLIYTIEEREP